MFNPSVILILAPHTDDGELGCGGSIAKFIDEGKSVHYVAFSVCASSLPTGLPADTLARECKKATTSLGISEDKLTLFDYEVREFASSRQAILDDMVIISKTLAPDLVIIPSSTDTHQDHATIHAEAIRAFKKSSILCYELPWNQITSTLNYFIPLNTGQLSKKMTALNCYASQSGRSYMREDFVRSLASVRGVQAGAEFAEAFEVYRIIQ